MTRTLEHLSLAHLRFCKNRDLLRLALKSADMELLPEKYHRAIRQAFRATINIIAGLDPALEHLTSGPPPHPD